MRAGTAIAAYLALIIGMLAIGIPAQQRGIVAGLWTTEALAIALPAMFALALHRVRPAPYLGLRRLGWKSALVAVVASAANQPVVSFLTWAAHSLLPTSVVADFDAMQRMLDAVFTANAGPMLATVVIAAPLGEELFFRGFAFPAMTKSWGVFWAALVSGMLFSSLHMNKVGFLGLMEIGILLAALRHWSGSLWAPIIGHAVNNGIAGVAFTLGFEDPAEPPPPLVLVLGALLLVIGIVAILHVLRRPPAAPAVEERAPRGAPIAAVLAAIWVVALFWGVRSLPLRLWTR